MMKRGAERVLRRGGGLEEGDRLNPQAIPVLLALMVEAKSADEMSNRVWTKQHSGQAVTPYPHSATSSAAPQGRRTVPGSFFLLVSGQIGLSQHF